LFFVADADENRFAPPSGKRVCDGEYNAEPCGDDGELEYAVIARLEGYAGDDGSCGGRAEATRPASSPRISGRMDDASGIRRRTCGHDDGENVGVIADATDEHGNSDQGYWRGCDWILCRDGKWRPVEAGTFPLAHGTPARVGCLRGYGNAINPWAAKAFIESYCAARKEQI
jgi:DNA (cytosine-5)-methyltransferase 1